MRTRLLPFLKLHWREVAGWTLVLLGAIAVLVGWTGVSNRDVEALQLPYVVSGGIGGVVLTSLGVGLLVAADIRRDRERLGRIEGELLELQDLVRDLAESSRPTRRGRGAA